MAGENYSVLLKAITGTEPTFNFSFRGYDRRQVDQYAQSTETQLAATLAESKTMAAQVSALTEELKRAERELVELRRRPALDEKTSFRHLGFRVEQILADADEQATETRRLAKEEADQVRAALVDEVTRERAIIAEEVRQTREMQVRVLEELDEARQAWAAEEARAAAEVEQAHADVANAEQELERLRVTADELIAAAQNEYERVTNSALDAAEKIHSDLAIETRILREEAYADATRVTRAARTYVDQAVAEAEQHALELDELVRKYRVRIESLDVPDLTLHEPVLRELPPAPSPLEPDEEPDSDEVLALSDRPAGGPATSEPLAATP